MALPLFCMEPLTEHSQNKLFFYWLIEITELTMCPHKFIYWWKLGFFFKLSVLTSFLNVQYRTGLFIGLFTAGI